MKKTIIASFVAASCMAGTAFAAAIGCNTDVAVNSKIAKSQAIIDQNAVTSPVSSFNWFNRVAVSGLANLEFAWGSNSPAGSFNHTGHATDLTVNNANLIFNAKINPWVAAHLNLAYTADALLIKHLNPRYWDNTGTFYYYPANPTGSPTYALIRARRDRVAVDEAYVTLGNFARTPFYLRIGKQYVPFGHYDPYPVFTPFTQLLSQTRQTAIVLGAVTNFGFYGSVYAFNGHDDWTTFSYGGVSYSKVKEENNIRNFGAKVGYHGSVHCMNHAGLTYDVNAGWIRTMTDTDLMAYNTTFMPNDEIIPDYFIFQENKVPGLAFHGDLNYGPFSLWANYVVALDGFKFIHRLGWTTYDYRPWAADINGSYAFKTMGHKSKFGLAYQWTGNFDKKVFYENPTPPPFYPVFWMPAKRYMADYMFNVWKNTDLTLAYAHDVLDGSLVHHPADGTEALNKSKTDTIILRLGIKF